MKDLTPQEQVRFMKAVKRLPANEGIVMLFALETGARLSECLSMRVEDVKDMRSVMVRTLKKRRDGEGVEEFREIPISSKLRVYLKAYLKMFEKLNNPAFNPENRLFITRKRRPMSKRYVQYVFLGIMQNLKLTRVCESSTGKKRHYGVHFHSLRHTFAKNLVRRGVQLPIIQQLLGHAYLMSTQIYLEPTRDDLFEAIA